MKRGQSLGINTKSVPYSLCSLENSRYTLTPGEVKTLP